MGIVSPRASFSIPNDDELYSGLVACPGSSHPDEPDRPDDDYADADQSERARVIVSHTPRQYVAPEPPEIQVVIGRLGSRAFRVSVRKPDGSYIRCGTQNSEAAAWDIALLVAQAVLAGAA